MTRRSNMLTIRDINLYWQYSLYIENDLKNTMRFIEPCFDNHSSYSSEFAKIIMLACSEIDVICRLICKEIDPTTDFDDDSIRSGKIDEYATLILARFPKLITCELKNTRSQDVIKPFENWSITPYSSPLWWNDYQKIKHYRHSNFSSATLMNAIYAVGGLIILNLYLYRLVSNTPYASPNEQPQIFSAEYFSPILMARANLELPDFM